MDYHILRLSPTRGGFFDPETRINLSRKDPQALLPVGTPISRAIQAALRSGGILDVNGTIKSQLQGEAAVVKSESIPQEEKADAESFPVHPDAPVPASEDVQVPDVVEPEEEPHQEESKAKSKKRSGKR